MILIVGASGQLGGLIAHRLLDNAKAVRILVRSGSSYDALVTAGAEVVAGDLKDATSLRLACRRIDAVITTANATARGGEDTIESVDLVGNRNLVDAAGRRVGGGDNRVDPSTCQAQRGRILEIARHHLGAGRDQRVVARSAAHQD